MDSKYPHWYKPDSELDPCCDYMGKEMLCEDHFPYKGSYSGETFKDRLLCFLGNNVIVSTDALMCYGRTSFCGTLCYVGCDFIIVNITYHRKPLSLHIPIKMIRFIGHH